MILASILVLSLIATISTAEMIVSEFEDGTMSYHSSVEDPCVIETPDGVINLGSLETKQFTVFIDAYHGSTFYWMVSFCKKEVSSPPIVDGIPKQACDSTDIPSYITEHSKDSNLCSFSLYDWLSGTTAEKRASDNVWVVSYKVAQPTTWLNKEGQISIECDPTVAEVDCKGDAASCAVALTNGPSGAYIYTATFLSPHACPISGGGGGGGGCGFGCAFLLIFFLGGFVYLVVFMAYNYKVKELRGRELLPHQEFWKSIPGLCKDGAIFLFQKIRSLCGSS